MKMLTTVNRNNKRRMTAREAKFKIKVTSIIAILLFVFVIILSINNKLLNDKIADLTARNNTYKIQNEEIIQMNDFLVSTIHELNDQLLQVSDTNKSMVDELNTLRNRSELYDKYEYAIIDELGHRTDLKYEEITLAEDLMLENGLDPHLMLGSIMVESTCNPSAVHPVTGATGYGQILNSTGKWVWEDLMGNSGYYPDLRKDGTSNIKMMAAYYNYLYDEVGSTFNVVKSYSGNSTNEGTQRYLNKINHYTNTVGVTIK